MFRATLIASVNVRHNVTGDNSVTEQKIKFEQTFGLSEGTGDDEAQTAWDDDRTVAASDDEDLDLLALLPDLITPGVTPSKLKSLTIYADPENTDDIVFSASASNGFVGPFADAITLHPGDLLMFVAPKAGWTLDGTHKSINIANSSASDAANYSIQAIAA